MSPVHAVVFDRKITRKSKLMSLSDAVRTIEDGELLGIGGWTLYSHPMALVREIIRQGQKNLRLAPSAASIAPDLLIAAGRAAEVHCVFISLEQFGLAPAFRRAAQSGSLTVWEMDGPGFAGALRAAACDLPYMLIPDLCTDLPKVNPDRYWPSATVDGDRRFLVVSPMSPTVTLLHGQAADEFGNVQLHGAPGFDVLMATASQRVIVSVDKIVSNAEIRRAPHMTKIPAAYVSAVVEAPGGAHPTASAGEYDIDQKHFRLYAAMAKSEEGAMRYLDEYVRCEGGEEGYRMRVKS